MIDVYEGQGSIDWPKVYASGVRRAYIKFWEHSYGLDHHALQNIAGARDAGLEVGLYYFAHPAGNPHDQAHEFLYNAADHLQNGDLPPALDLEITEGHSMTYLNDWKAQWLAEVDNVVQCLSVFYSYYYFWKKMTLYPNRPIWGAGSGHGFRPPASWSIWQYGLGHVPGITGAVDLDRFVAEIPRIGSGL